MSVYRAFGKCHIDISGTDYLIHLRDRLRAVCHGSNSLSTSGLEYSLYTGDLCSRKYYRGYSAIASGRGTHYDLGYSGTERGSDVHQNGRRICRFAAGHVYACSCYGSDPLSKDRAVLTGGKKALSDLLFMICPDIIKCLLHYLIQSGIY